MSGRLKIRCSRIRALACILAVVLSSLLPLVAHAETAAQIKARLDAVKKEASAAGAAFSDAYWKLDETEVALSKTNKRLAATTKKLAKARKRLNRRADEMYRRDPVGFMNFLVGASSFEQLANRADYIQRIGDADAQAIIEVKALKRELTADKKRLERQRVTRAADLQKLRARRDELQTRLKSLDARFRQLKRQLDAARHGNLPAGTVSGAGPNGLVFPVVGSYYYANTWGASRSGGRRSHQGTDIMAPHGTPCVAIVSGTVRASVNGLGGNCIWLRGSNGWLYYYAHLQGWAVRSGSVRAGQVIGYVGSTGNATANAPHLHLQMHPGGGGPVNPYFYLRSME